MSLCIENHPLNLDKNPILDLVKKNYPNYLGSNPIGFTIYAVGYQKSSIPLVNFYLDRGGNLYVIDQ